MLHVLPPSRPAEDGFGVARCAGPKRIVAACPGARRACASRNLLPSDFGLARASGKACGVFEEFTISDSVFITKTYISREVLAIALYYKFALYIYSYIEYIARI